MTSEFREPAYKLSNEVNHFRDFNLGWNDDLTHEPFEGEDAVTLGLTRLFEYPDPVIYRADVELVTYIDFPTTDNSWSVMSKQMLDVLQSVGELPAHRVIPIAVVDWNLPRERWYDGKGEFNKQIANWDYVAVHFTEHLDVFNYERSKYTLHPEDYFLKGVRKVDEFVFNVPPQGLPPLFRIDEATASLFVSAEARAALKEARIKGTQFYSLRGYQMREEPTVDVPVELPIAA